MTTKHQALIEYSERQARIRKQLQRNGSQVDVKRTSSPARRYVTDRSGTLIRCQVNN